MRLEKPSCPLVACALAAVLAGCGGGDPTLVLEVNPPDAVVSLDGYVHPGGSPHEISFKKAGKYTLTVSKPGFQPVEMVIPVEEGDALRQKVELMAIEVGPGSRLVIAEDPPVETPPQIPVDPPEEDTFLINVTSYPSGAQVMAQMPGEARRRMGVTPLTIRAPSSGATEVFLAKTGYRTQSRVVIATDTGADVNLSVALEKTKVRVDDYPSNLLIPTDPVVPVDSSSYGFISVTTNPWTAVHIDGKAAGNTPLVNFKVESGRHVVLMENRDMGVRRKKVVNVRPGEHIRLVETLD